MVVQVLSFLVTVSLFSYASCHSNIKGETVKSIWNLPESQLKSDTKFGKQMPPHHEPDAVLINTGGGNERPRAPEGNFPAFGGSPGFPRPGRRPELGRPPFPFPGFQLPAFPNSFGIRGQHPFPGLHVPGLPLSPHGPFMPNEPNVYGGHSFTVGNGYFPNSGIPVTPNFIHLDRVPNNPDRTGLFPTFRSISPDGRRNDFQPDGSPLVPFYPEAFIPNQPELNPNSNFPKPDFYGGRETYDEPTRVGPFPLKSPWVSNFN